MCLQPALVCLHLPMLIRPPSLLSAQLSQVCVTIVGTYFLLNAENYHWHWTAFSAGASTCEPAPCWHAHLPAAVPSCGGSALALQRLPQFVFAGTAPGQH